MSMRNVKGLSDIQKVLDQLPAQVEQKVMRGAMRQGANVLRDGARVELAGNASEISGELSRGLKVTVSARRGQVKARVRATGKHAHVANWVEHGTAAHQIAPRNGKVLMFNGRFAEVINHPGARPKPFMRTALEKRADAAVVAVGNEAKRRLTAGGIQGAADIVVEAE